MAKELCEYHQVGNGNPVKILESSTVLQKYILHQKAIRNNMLADTDKYVIADYPTEKLSEWETYRQALRNFDFSSYSFDDDISWPDKPE